jgi:hypothetical protein
LSRQQQGFLVLFRSTSDTIVAGMLLSLAYLKAIQWLAPFKDPALNLMKETTVWQIFFVFLIALLIKMDDFDSGILVVCLMLVFFVNFLILLGQYLLQCCGHRHVCVPDTAASHQEEEYKDTGGAVEMQRVTSLVVSPDTPSSSCSSSSSSVVSAAREGSGGSEINNINNTTTAVPAAAGSQSQSSPCSDMMHTGAVDTRHRHTHSPFHPLPT